ncbi:hypothetical protein MNV49_006186 [Pseudohyphozyma bogoriensis]|nr:hypothetical protein MNV49_006186 [Pseudohyphozyma bogoriensis]
MDLPINLSELIEFILEPTSQLFIDSVANEFFTTSHARRVVIREEHGCWDRLPLQWQQYFFNRVTKAERSDALRCLADGKPQDDWPPSLRKYITSCTSLSLDRQCSDHPVASFPALAPRTTPLPPPTTTSASGTRKKMSNAEKAGLNPKKLHEVQRFSTLVSELLKDEDPPTHAVDVGSGRAHLSRALAAPPLSLDVLAVDWSPSQTSGAHRLDEIKAKIPSTTTTTSGSLTHLTSSLDAPAVQTILETWPEGGQSMLVALHACGDLTVDSLKAFVAAEHAAEHKRKAVVVGCCYNLMTPEIYPLSNLVKTLPTTSIPLSINHLRLTPQSPPTWHLSTAHKAALATSISKLVNRARLEAELEVYGHAGERSVGRIPDTKDYATYRRKALEEKYQMSEDTWPALGFGSSDAAEADEWEEAVFKFQVFWTLRSWLGPPIESLLLLDRFAPADTPMLVVQLFATLLLPLGSLAISDTPRDLSPIIVARAPGPEIWHDHSSRKSRIAKIVRRASEASISSVLTSLQDALEPHEQAISAIVDAINVEAGKVNIVQQISHIEDAVQAEDTTFSELVKVDSGADSDELTTGSSVLLNVVTGIVNVAESVHSIDQTVASANGAFKDTFLKLLDVIVPLLHQAKTLRSLSGNTELNPAWQALADRVVADLGDPSAKMLFQ